MPEELSHKQEFVHIVFKKQRPDKPPDRVNLSAGPDMLHLKFIGRHISGAVDYISVIEAPVPVEQLILVEFIHRCARDKIHGLDQHSLNLVPDHKVRQLIPHPPSPGHRIQE